MSNLAYATKVFGALSSWWNFVVWEFWDTYGDPRVRHLPFFAGGPFTVLALITFYVLFTTVLGPQLMKNRSAYDLRLVMILYNVSLVFINLFGCFLAFVATDFGTKTWFCHRVDQTDNSASALVLIYLGFGYFCTKFLDLLDTVFFILRKRNDQVTFLHCFHHAVMPVISWVGVKFAPGGNSAFMPLINSFIHTIMYFYYGIAAIGPVTKPFLWWKPWLTIAQMVQFGLIFLHSVHVFFVKDCDWPKVFAFFEGSHAVLFFCLFYSFFKKSYYSKTSKQA